MNKVRCAIYTRKSSDEGLDQAFNSLDAQREACEAYIKSQKHEGWKVLPTLYDDGGASGGNMDRTALQQLLTDVDAGRIDMIVVYKIDRLTRSLSDFAKLVDRLDAGGASFVSVTQQFNTSTSMGRLTLNVLLSFAQFEREVTAERIRDKIAASKKKGMWMGGLVPLGFDKTDAGLVINQPEAATVRTLFQSYLELGSVRRLKEYADQSGLRTKTRVLKSERVIEGKPFSRGRLYHLLSNPIYVGKIRHKAEIYQGLHEAIITTNVWDEVQEQLSRNAANRRTRTNTANPSPLAGKVFDADGRPLTPSHANKAGRRYRYYVSNASERIEKLWRIPAVELELAVEHAIKNDHRTRLECQQSDVRVSLALVSAVRRRTNTLEIDIQVTPESNAQQIIVPYTLRRRGIESKIVLAGGHRRDPDVALIKRVIRAMDWIEMLKRGDTISEIAKRDAITPGHVTHHIDLGFMSPKVLSALATGTQRPDIYANRLSKITIPARWVDQDQIFLV